MRSKLFLPAIATAVMFMSACSKKEAATEDVNKAAEDAGNVKVADMHTEEAYPGATGVWQSVIIDTDTLRYEVINGENIMEGDIIIPGSATQPDTSGIKTYSTGRADRESRWNNNTVYYAINPNLPDKDRVNGAIIHWEQKTPLRFVRRTTQANYIYFTGGSGCSSAVGKVGGKQDIHLAAGCSLGNTIHEIGHAVGLFHEQSRLDRNKFITIHWDRIENDKKYNFQTWKARGYDGFDRGEIINLNSIMMYDPYAFAKGNQPTITLKDGSTYPYQRVGLSERDINTIKFMYP